MVEDTHRQQEGGDEAHDEKCQGFDRVQRSSCGYEEEIGNLQANQEGFIKACF